MEVEVGSKEEEDVLEGVGGGLEKTEDKERTK